MLRFVLGHMALFLPVWSWNVLGEPRGVTECLKLFMLLCASPCWGAWGAAELVRVWSRPRVFDRRAGMHRRSFALGWLAGVGALALTAVVTLVDHLQLHPGVLFLLSSLCSGAFVFLFGRRMKPGRCVSCDYDLQGSLDMGRCPECGTPFSPASGGARLKGLTNGLLPAGTERLRPIQEATGRPER